MQQTPYLPLMLRGEIDNKVVAKRLRLHKRAVSIEDTDLPLHSASDAGSLVRQRSGASRGASASPCLLVRCGAPSVLPARRGYPSSSGGAWWEPVPPYRRGIGAARNDRRAGTGRDHDLHGGRRAQSAVEATEDWGCGGRRGILKRSTVPVVNCRNERIVP